MSPLGPKVKPPLDPGFKPVFGGTMRGELLEDKIRLAVRRGGKTVYDRELRVFPHEGEGQAQNEYLAARWAKFLQWQIGGDEVAVTGHPELAAYLEGLYAPGGKRAFDREFFKKVYKGVSGPRDGPALGGHWKGCRVGFDLGASDRKCAAVKDGEIVHTEEVPWDPASFADPRRHIEGIQDSIRRAAEKLPRVDAIGGCAAGIFVDGQVRRSTLFRGIPEDGYEALVRPLFREVRKPWPDVDFSIVNDGAVAALAGAYFLERAPMLGLALGSSLAAGFVGPDGRLPDTIDELAFLPIDARPDAPADPWSGERGCAAQYLSQQGVARLALEAGFGGTPENAAETLKYVQKRAAAGDPAARDIYESIGVYLGYAIMQYMFYYVFGDVLLLGRVLTGPGGDILIAAARHVLEAERPEAAKTMNFHTLDETGKRHGQAIAAASLPPGGTHDG